MPLVKSATNEARSKNISEMVKSGMPRNQAIAAAYHNQREAREKQRKKKGGK